MSDLYKAGVNSIMAGQIDLGNADLSALLIDTSLYTADLDTDLSQADIPVEAVLSTVTLTGSSVTDGIFSADGVTFPAVVGNEASAIILVLNAPTYSASTLIAYLDDATEFPITLDGSDVIVSWDVAEGIFSF